MHSDELNDVWCVQPLTTVRVVDIEGIEEEPDSKARSPSDEHPENDSDGIEKAA